MLKGQVRLLAKTPAGSRCLRRRPPLTLCRGGLKASQPSTAASPSASGSLTQQSVRDARSMP